MQDSSGLVPFQYPSPPASPRGRRQAQRQRDGDGDPDGDGNGDGDGDGGGYLQSYMRRYQAGGADRYDSSGVSGTGGVSLDVSAPSAQSRYSGPVGDDALALQQREAQLQQHQQHDSRGHPDDQAARQRVPGGDATTAGVLGSDDASGGAGGSVATAGATHSSGPAGSGGSDTDTQAAPGASQLGTGATMFADAALALAKQAQQQAAQRDGGDGGGDGDGGESGSDEDDYADDTFASSDGASHSQSPAASSSGGSDDYSDEFS